MRTKKHIRMKAIIEFITGEKSEEKHDIECFAWVDVIQQP
jgi:hypothetical protein